MDIRPYDESDERHVVALWRICGLVVPWNDPNMDIQRKLKVDRDLFLVVEEDDDVIATVMAGYEGHRGWVNYLAVHPDQQRQGIGQRLMAEVERLLDDRGCPKVNLQVRESNEAVIRFYEALGYKQDACVSMGKRLEEDSPAMK